MARLLNLFRSPTGDSKALLELRERFDLFRRLLEKNNEVLRLLGDMEEKAQGDYLFDLIYIRRSMEELSSAVDEIIQLMVSLGGDAYTVLQERKQEIEKRIAALLPGSHPPEPSPPVLTFHQLDSTLGHLVGSKCAQLGEMRKLGLNVPSGFAITAWSYHRFLQHNRLQEAIDSTLRDLDIRSHTDLVKSCEHLRNEILAGEIPPDLAEGIMEAYGEHLARRGSGCVALRSSAIGEDSLFSFAGQYRTFLNVPPDRLLDCYREILASKFTPQALFYLLSHSIEEREMAMAVGCTEMVDAVVSGVLYTRDPIAPSDNTVLVHAIPGLGPFLVEGRITPDVFKLRRDRDEIVGEWAGDKPIRLVLDPAGGTRQEQNPEEERRRLCLDRRILFDLTSIAVRLEDHYGRAQDIEWAVDRETSRVVVLQARPLRTLAELPGRGTLEVEKMPVLLRGGTTVCPGAGGGKVVVVKRQEEIASIAPGSVIVAPNPFPHLGEALPRAQALVTAIGGSASHLASLAREQRVPTLVGVEGVIEALEPGRLVTVDSTDRVIYDGVQDELIRERHPEYDLFADTVIFDLLRRLLEIVSPLNLVSPKDPDFLPERCETFHDITRYAHQRGIEEVFRLARVIGQRRSAGARLKTSLPLPVHVLDLDGVRPDGSQPWSSETKIPPGPFRAFWQGMLEVGWPGHLPNPNRFIPVIASHGGNTLATQFTENSFAVMGREYALVSLRLGFHFTSVEAMACAEAERNFIRYHYKGGGAAADRRQRRIRLLADLLGRMGFEHIVKADFIDSVMTFRNEEDILDTLNRIGRLTLMTKQLDMALSNDRVTAWYCEDFARRLGLDHERRFPI